MEDREKTVKAIVAESGNVRLIHGDAPYLLDDVVGELTFARESLDYLLEMCDINIENIIAGATFQNTVKDVLDGVVDTCTESIRRIQESFPDDGGLRQKKF